MKISFLAIGDELLSGKVQEINGKFLAQEFLSLGLKIDYLLMVGDNSDEMIQAFEFLSSASDIIICTGGLGPTPDDLTTEVFAKFAKLQLEFHQEILDQIEKKFKIRNIQMPLTNKKQAIIPKSAIIIPNISGTAPGYKVNTKNNLWFFFPGVPSEFQKMTKEFLIPELVNLEQTRKALRIKTLRIYGIPESAIAQKLNKLQFHPELKIAYLPEFPDIHLRISAILPDEKKAEKIIEDSIKILREQLGEYLVSEDDEPLELIVGKLLKQKGLTLATAESCTGGLLSKKITDIPGSSDYFLGGFITYSNQLKMQQLGISEKILNEKGAVSKEVALEMAKSAKEKTGADMAISITGIAGPAGATPEKPVGLVHIALAFENEIWSQKFTFLPISRDAVRTLSAQTALEIIRRKLLNLRMPGEKKDDDKQF